MACEFSGIVRDAFRVRGHDAWSCDLIPCERGPEHHFQMDIRDASIWFTSWDLFIAFPPCTHLSSSGAKWFYAKRTQQEEAIGFVKELLSFPVPRLALENPVGVISTRIRKPDQIIQPYQFGHDASKKTCLWLKGLPLLVPSGPEIAPRIVNGKSRWANQTDSGQNKLPPSERRAKDRSRTYQGIADCMAEQWGGNLRY